MTRILLKSFVALLLLIGLTQCTQHEFAAEVSQMMHIIINSLYSSREIFLRELIANASDALDKLRQVGLTDRRLTEDWPLEIKIRADAEAKTLTVWDSGIGMTPEELTKNLGTIARSGTKEFLKTFSDKSDSAQIGQFGVGFYSSFLAGDVVHVISKTADGEKHIWKCDIRQGTFSVEPCADEEDGVGEEAIGRQGTKVRVFLKELEDGDDFTNVAHLKDLIHRHAEFITFPIFVYEEKRTEEEVPIEDATEEGAKAEEKEKPEGDDVVVGDDESSKPDAAPKTKKITKIEGSYVLVNSNQPIWTRDPSEVTPEAYVSFYKSMTGDTEAPFDYTHFKVAGATTDFRGILYIPRKPHFQLLSNDAPKDFLRLYVKRMLITSEVGDYPRYLSFVRSLVDADDVPLNVSRETLQKTKVVASIKKSVQNKTLSLLQKMASNETLYNEFYGVYANHLKLGIIADEDQGRKKELASLLRFRSTAVANMTSFDDYIGRFKTNQTDIYYVSGTDVATLRRLPYVEALLKRDLEVLLLTDTYDEYMVQALPQYKEHTLKNVAKGGITFPTDSESDKADKETLATTFKPLTAYMQRLFSKRLEKVVLSELLDSSPLAIVANTFGWSPAMEKLMASQGAGAADPMASFFAKQKKIMEINPRHPLMLGLLKRIQTLQEASGNENKEAIPEADKELDASLRLLYDAALLHSGYELKNPAAFAHRVEDMIRAKYEIQPLQETERVIEEEPEDSFSMPDFGGGAGGMPDFSNMDFSDTNDMPDFSPSGASHSEAEHAGEEHQHDHATDAEVPFDKEEL